MSTINLTNASVRVIQNVVRVYPTISGTPGTGSAVTVAGIAGPVIGAAELTDAQYAALADGDTLFAAAVIADPAGVTLAFESAGVVRAVTFAALLAALGAVVSPFALLTAGGDTLVTAGGDTITYGA